MPTTTSLPAVEEEQPRDVEVQVRLMQSLQRKLSKRAKDPVKQARVTEALKKHQDEKPAAPLTELQKKMMERNRRMQLQEQDEEQASAKKSSAVGVSTGKSPTASVSKLSMLKTKGSASPSPRRSNERSPASKNSIASKKGDNSAAPKKSSQARPDGEQEGTARISPSSTAKGKTSGRAAAGASPSQKSTSTAAVAAVPPPIATANATRSQSRVSAGSAPLSPTAGTATKMKKTTVQKSVRISAQNEKLGRSQDASRRGHSFTGDLYGRETAQGSSCLADSITAAAEAENQPPAALSPTRASQDLAKNSFLPPARKTSKSQTLKTIPEGAAGDSELVPQERYSENVDSSAIDKRKSQKACLSVVQRHIELFEKRKVAMRASDPATSAAARLRGTAGKKATLAAGAASSNTSTCRASSSSNKASNHNLPKRGAHTVPAANRVHEMKRSASWRKPPKKLLLSAATKSSAEHSPEKSTKEAANSQPVLAAPGDGKLRGAPDAPETVSTSTSDAKSQAAPAPKKKKARSPSDKEQFLLKDQHDATLFQAMDRGADGSVDGGDVHSWLIAPLGLGYSLLDSKALLADVAGGGVFRTPQELNSYVANCFDAVASHSSPEELAHAAATIFDKKPLLGAPNMESARELQEALARLHLTVAEEVAQDWWSFSKCAEAKDLSSQFQQLLNVY